MTLASDRTMTLEAYLTDDDGTDTRYELVNGVLVEMGAESDLNTRIALFLMMQFGAFLPFDCLRNKTEIALSRDRALSRYPDFLVLTPVGADAIAQASRSMITLNMPPPALVVKVVSPGAPGSDNYNRDYLDKPQEYAARGIPEYWIIDPERQWIWVLVLHGNVYERTEFAAGQTLHSPTFPELNLTVA